MLNPPYAGATPEQLQNPMVIQFLAIHDMFRRELKSMLNFVDLLTSGEVQLGMPETQMRIQGLIRVGQQYTHHLHMHHTIESSRLFPALQAEGLDSAIVDRLVDDHDEIAVLIDQFSEGIRSASAVDPAIVDSDLRRLSEALHAHLAYEETHVCPMLTRLRGWF